MEDGGKNVAGPVPSHWPPDVADRQGHRLARWSAKMCTPIESPILSVGAPPFECLTYLSSAGTAVTVVAVGLADSILNFSFKSAVNEIGHFGLTLLAAHAQ
jgi:hypothetical protein